VHLHRAQLAVAEARREEVVLIAHRVVREEGAVDPAVRDDRYF